MSDCILDFRASLNVSPHKEWFTTYVARRDFIKVSNDQQTCPILGIRDVQLKFQNGATLVLKNVRHVPAIQKSLISIGKLDDASYDTIFGSKIGKIAKGDQMVTHGIKPRTLYTLHVSSVRHHVINVVEQPSVELWHKRIGHMYQKGVQILSCFGYFSLLFISNL